MPDTVSAALSDIQTGVVRGVDAPIVAYLFFRITDRDAFIKQLPGGTPTTPTPGLGIATAIFYAESARIDPKSGKLLAIPPDASALANIAFTYSGLAALGVAKETLATFPEPFQEGMAHRAAFLGDNGPVPPERRNGMPVIWEGAPENWEGYLGSREVHGVAWASFPKAPAGNDIPDFLSKLGTAAIAGAEVVHVELGMANYKTSNGSTYAVEHFGFRDGISQPFVDIGQGTPPGGGEASKPGELLLGYPDEQNSRQLLPANQKLRDNGTYMVFRKLEQDVVAFREFTKQKELPEGPGTLAAQMIGRWPDGTPLVDHPKGPAGLAEPANDFLYQATDPQGLSCPIGAHVRRANPRDTNERDEARRHRLFRRGISYGGDLLPERPPSNPTPRGLLFVSLQARIDRQFEFVQARWMNNGAFSGQAGANLDPLTGAHKERTCDAFLPSGTRRAPITGLPRFVTLRGGDYFFIPSFSALAAMKAKDSFPPDDPLSPVIANALGATLPSKSDDSKELRSVGEWLLRVPHPFVQVRNEPATIVVARHQHVKAVLLDDQAFTSELFGDSGKAITDGKGMLVGLPNDQTNDGRERRNRENLLLAAMKQLAGTFASAEIEDLAKSLTKDVVTKVRSSGRLDVVEDFGRVVPVQIVAKLFGVTKPEATSTAGIAGLLSREKPADDVPEDWRDAIRAFADDRPYFTMQAWTRMTFLQTFINLPKAEEAAAFGKGAAEELLRHIDGLVATARANIGSEPPRNLLEALVRVPAGTVPDLDEHVRLLLAEFVAGTVETTNAALANAVNYVLDHKPEVKQALVKRGGPETWSLEELVGDLDNDKIERLILEILRFDPMGPISFRTAKAGAKIDNVPVPANARVALVPAAAMLDPTVFTNPNDIDFNRSLPDYLHFGVGLHECWGRFIALPLLREMFKAIVTLPELRRAAGKAGEKRQFYPLLVDGLTVRFKP